MAWNAYCCYFVPTGDDNQHRIGRHKIVAIMASADDAAYWRLLPANVEAVTSRLGAGAINRTGSAIDIPDWAEPWNCFYDETTDAVTQTPQFTPQYPFRALCQAWHDRLEYLDALLLAVSHNYLRADKEVAEDILFGLHQGAFIIHRADQDGVPGATLRNNSGKRLWTTEKKIEVMRAAALGPDIAEYDREDPETFFEVLAGEALSADARNVGGRALHIVVINTRDAIRNPARVQSIGALIGNKISGADGITNPTHAQLREGDWIKDLNY